jgi:hypothetical protein
VPTLRLTIGPHQFTATYEVERAPRTCAAVQRLLPLRGKLLQARWSGEAAWMPLGDLNTDIGFENHTSHPAPGDLLFYPGGFSETEILVPYGATLFASRMGQLAGNHFATIEATRAELRAIGDLIVWNGAQAILIEPS